MNHRTYDEVSLILDSVYSAGDALLVFRFGDVQKDIVQVELIFNSNNHEISTTLRVYAWHLNKFIKSLRQLHQELAGSVFFLDWDYSPALCFTAVNKWRGLIAVGGSFEPAGFDCDFQSEAQYNSPDSLGRSGGIRITFDGYQFDQSMLPRFANSMQDYLDQSGLKMLDPN